MDVQRGRWTFEEHEKRKMVSPDGGAGGSVRRVDAEWGNRIASGGR